MISVLILTLDEETNIDACIGSLDWCDDVVVLDSVSRDSTQVRARARGARVIERPFDDYAAQRNFGLREVRYKHNWVLMLDADERVPAALADEMRAAVAAAPADVTLFRMRRKDFLLDRWIRASGGYPIWFGRLVRLGRVWVDRPINEQYCTDGRVAALRAHLHHYPFAKGFSAWYLKHDRYSSMEAQLLADRTRSGTAVKALLSRDPTQRRQALKSLVYTLPGRPVLMFVLLYLLRGGFLEGRAGLTYCALRSFYELMIDCKLLEIRLRRAGLSI